MGIASDLRFVILAALAGGFLAHFLKQPLLFGYIFAGVLVGPHTGGLTVERIEDIEKLAEIGVALLLFTLGLEFSFRELRALAKVAFIAAPLQILSCVWLGSTLLHAGGFSSSDALWIGAAIAVSSTMVVLKTLSSRDGSETPAGRAMLGILIAQDLAVVPLMLILPQLSAETVDTGALVAAAVKSILFLVMSYLAGTRVLPRLFTYIAIRGTRELFFLATLGVALGAGIVSYELGLSFALGAFVAGMLLSETEFNHQALSDMSGLRDLFALIFFVSVGMLFDPRFFFSHIGTVALLSGGILCAKALLTTLAIRCSGFMLDASVLAGMALAQLGEFAFVIANAGVAAGRLSQDSYSLVISITVVTMVATPILFRAGELLSDMLRSRQASDLPVDSAPRPEREGHVVIIGGGVVGQYVGRVLRALERPCVVIESDSEEARSMRNEGIDVIFGDGTKRVILEAAKVPASRLVVVSTTNDSILPHIVSEIKALKNDVPIVVRVEEGSDVEKVSSLDVREIVQPQAEVGLEMVRQALLSLGLAEGEIFTALGRLRAERYARAGSRQTESEKGETLLRAAALLEFVWIELSRASALCGSTLLALRLRERFGVSVVALVRNEEFSPAPNPDLVLTEGDLVGVLGTRAALESFRAAGFEHPNSDLVPCSENNSSH